MGNYVFPKYICRRRYISRKLKQPDELSGLLNQSLEALGILKKQKKFTKSKTQDYSELLELFEEAKMYDVRRLDDKDEILDMDEPF